MNTINNNFEGTQLKKMRKRLGMNQQDFGCLMGVSKWSLNRSEHGKSKIRYCKIATLSKYCLNPNFIYGDKNITTGNKGLSEVKRLVYTHLNNTTYKGV